VLSLDVILDPVKSVVEFGNGWVVGNAEERLGPSKEADVEIELKVALSDVVLANVKLGGTVSLTELSNVEEKVLEPRKTETEVLWLDGGVCALDAPEAVVERMTLDEADTSVSNFTDSSACPEIVEVPAAGVVLLPTNTVVETMTLDEDDRFVGATTDSTVCSELGEVPPAELVSLLITAVSVLVGSWFRLASAVTELELIANDVGVLLRLLRLVALLRLASVLPFDRNVLELLEPEDVVFGIILELEMSPSSASVLADHDNEPKTTLLDCDCVVGVIALPALVLVDVSGVSIEFDHGRFTLEAVAVSMV